VYLIEFPAMRTIITTNIFYLNRKGNYNNIDCPINFELISEPTLCRTARIDFML